MTKVRIFLPASIVLVGLFVLAGCDSEAKSTNESATSARPVTCQETCGSCGKIRPSAECCKPGAKLCKECSQVKDSPKCCKATKGTGDVALCSKCGQIKGSDECCKLGAKPCPKCGKAKGSPGCCK
jgi:hypothetical protein